MRIRYDENYKINLISYLEELEDTIEYNGELPKIQNIENKVGYLVYNPETKLVEVKYEELIEVEEKLEYPKPLTVEEQLQELKTQNLALMEAVATLYEKNGGVK